MSKTTLPNGWKIVKLKEIAEKSSLKNQGFKYSLVLTNSAQRGIILQSEHFDKDIAVDENIDGYFIVNDGNFVYNPRISTTAPCGPIRRNHLGITGVMSPLYTVFTINSNTIDENYIEYFFLSSVWYKYMKSIANYGARHDRMSITDYGFFSMPIPLPPLNEQHAIANILTTADKLIATKERLISTKQKQKRWLMQNLLTGKMRLPGFSGEWLQKAIQDCGVVTTGSTPPTTNQENYGDTYLWVTPTDIDENMYINDTERKLSAKGMACSRFVKAGSVLVTCIASIGKNAILLKDGSCNQQINAITPNEMFCNEYLYHIICFSENKIKKLAGKTATHIINKDTFQNIIFSFPPISEQTAIAEVLTTADREIQLLIRDLEQHKLQKKYLMQQLLTGKIRVEDKICL